MTAQTNTLSDELVERLRRTQGALSRDQREQFFTKSTLVNPDGPEAADLIERIQEEARKYREALARAGERAEAGRAKCKELQQLLDGLYGEIRAAVGEHPSFGHSANSMLLRADGQFFQIRELARTALSADTGEDHSG